MAKGFGKPTPNPSSQKRIDQTQIDQTQIEIQRLMTLGLQAQQSGDLDQAETHYQRILKLEADQGDALHLLGVVAHQRGNAQLAIHLIEKALKAWPEIAVFHNSLGTVYAALDQRDQAIHHYQKAITREPDFAEAHNNLGTVLRDQGNLAAAMIHFQQAIVNQPDFAEAYNNLGITLADQGDFERAKPLFQKAIDLNSGFAEAYHNLGHTFQALQQLDQAVTAFHQAIAVQPDHLQARYNLGKVLWELQRVDEAIAVFQQTLQIDPEHTFARYMLAIMGVLPVPDRMPIDWVTSLFDGYAPRFDRHLVEKLAYHIPEQLFHTLVQQIGEGSRFNSVLDLGCGTGLCGVQFRPITNYLVGVDLSAKMLDQAYQRGVYDQLIQEDLLVPLQSGTQAFDLVIAADVFIYLGDLSPIFAACTQALQPGGYFGFSIEAGTGESYALGSLTGRFAHSTDYIRQLAIANDLSEISSEPVMIRTERSQPVHGYLWILRRLVT
jgi:predicted TPR repeat methyltransferase